MSARRVAAALFLAAALGACAPAEGPPVGLDGGAPVPRDGATDGCMLASTGGAPEECFAQWSCGLQGTLTLACGAADDAGVVCVCLQPDSEALVLGVVPPSCMDPTVVSAFARDNCLWSWL